MNIDVIVCAKNRAKPLDRVLRQISAEIPFKNLIVIYGTSIDETKETALRYTDKVFWDEDLGLGAARNLGIRMTSSKIVAMIDSDIILPKGWLQKLAIHLLNPKVAAAMGTCIYGYGCLPLQKLWEHRSSIWREQYGCHNVLFKRDIVLELGNFNKMITGAGEDYDLYHRLKNTGFKWIWDKEVIVYHPMNMLEYFKHKLWWQRGISSQRKETPISPFALCRRIIRTIKNGLMYLRIHPVLSLYIPLIDTVSLMIDFKVRRQPN